MKKLVLMTLSLCLLAGTPMLARAAEEPAKKAKRADKPAREEMLKKYDKNGDGKLDESEKAAMKEDRKKARGERKQDKQK
jgi:hypothetical protein